MKATIVKDRHGNVWLNLKVNDWQTNSFQLRDPINDAIEIKECLNDFILFDNYEEK